MSIRLIFKCVFFVLAFRCACAEENFLLINNATDEVVLQIGTNIHERMSPASTFKIVLSLIGYDVGILKDEWNPKWDFQKGYVVYKESWKAPQTPRTWMKDSCIWYSQILTAELGIDLIKSYLKAFEYGNQDMSGGLREAWLDSSLKISVAEQVKLIRGMLQENIPVKSSAIKYTKSLLFLAELEGGGKLFGKRGLSDNDIGWFVGWIEYGNNFFPFTYNIRGQKIDGGRMIPRVIDLWNSR